MTEECFIIIFFHIHNNYIILFVKIGRYKSFKDGWLAIKSDMNNSLVLLDDMIHKLYFGEDNDFLAGTNEVFLFQILTSQIEYNFLSRITIFIVVQLNKSIIFTIAPAIFFIYMSINRFIIISIIMR